MVHIAKLAVGITGLTHLRQVQAERLRIEPPLRHRTRNAPRRTAEVVGGGSLYWVIAGAMLVRQPILDIIEDHWDDGSPCAGLVLDPALVRVEGRPVRAFQGWRYLEAGDAPPDIGPDAGPDSGHDPAAMPPALRSHLRALCLI